MPPLKESDMRCYAMGQGKEVTRLWFVEFLVAWC